MIDLELAESPSGDWTLNLRGSNQAEARGPTRLAALGKFILGNREVLGLDWLDDPDAPVLDFETLGRMVADDPERFGVRVETPASPT